MRRSGLTQPSPTWTARPWRLIADHVTTHVAWETQTALLARPEIQLMWLPEYAC